MPDALEGRLSGDREGSGYTRSHPHLVRREEEVWHLRVRARQENPDRRCRHPANVRNVVERWPDFKYSRRPRFRVDDMTGSASFACDGVAGPDIAVLRFRAESRCGQRGSEHHSILYLAYRHTSLGCMGFCPVALLIEGAVPSPV